MHFQRYALFYTAPDGPLADFGAAWLGRDIATGMPVAHPIMNGVTGDIAEITERPRKYGFHGTIKAPFELAEAMSQEQLEAVIQEICATSNAITLDGLCVSVIRGFLALTPIGDTTKLNELAATMVRKLDRCRTYPTEAELQKRNHDQLTLSQAANLQNWGYPYVLDDFQFHMTLTGKLAQPDAETLQAHLTAALVNTLPTPFEIRDLTLVGEDETGCFIEVKRFTLGT